MICTEMFEKFLYFLVDLGKYESYNFYKRGGDAYTGLYILGSVSSDSFGY